MAQLTSIEEICHLYPNLQVDNGESVQYMVPDDKIIQYTDAQMPAAVLLAKHLEKSKASCGVMSESKKGHQVLAAIDSSNIQFRQSPAATQQSVFMVDTVEAQQLEAGKSSTSYKQPRLVVQQISAGAQPAHQILGTQQPFILQQLDHGNNESYLCKNITDSDKSQCIVQMDQNKSQSMNSQSQYVIHPIQANLVHVDSSKQQQNSLQTQSFSYQQDLSNVQSCITKKADSNELQQPTIKRLDGKKLQYQTFVGQIDSVNRQHQYIMQHIEPSVQKNVVEVGKQERHIIMQQVDGTKQNSFILQNLRSHNYLSNQIVVNQPKGSKNQEGVIQNIGFNEKETQSVKLQNIENTHFIMQGLDGNNRPQVQYQTQHFIVPQGEKIPPKVVVQRVAMPKTVASTPQLILQQFRPSASDHGTQIVVQQLDLSKQNLLPYLVTSSAKNSTIAKLSKESELVDVDLQYSHHLERENIYTEKEEEVETESTIEGDTNTANTGMGTPPDKRQRNVSFGLESKAHSSLPSGDVIQYRTNQPIQTPEGSGRQVNAQQQENISNRRFTQHQAFINHNNIHRTPQQIQQQPRFYSKVIRAENHQTSYQGQVAVGDNAEQQAQLQIPSEQQKMCQLVFEDQALDDLIKDKQETLEFDQNGSSVVTSLSSVPTANLQQYTKVPLKQNELDTNSTGLLLIPKSENQVYTNQYQTGLRYQGSLSHVKDLGIEVNKSGSSERTSSTSDIQQKVEVQQEPSILKSAPGDNSQKPSNITGVTQQKIPVKSYIKQETSEPSMVRAGEIVMNSRLQQFSNNAVPTSMLVSTEQYSEAAANESERKKSIPYAQNMSPPVSTNQSQNNSPVNVRTSKGGSRVGKINVNTPNTKSVHQFSPVVRGIQQNSVRGFQSETIHLGRKSRDFKGANKIGTGGNQIGPRPVVYHLASVNSGDQGSNEIGTVASTVTDNTTTTVTTTTSTTTPTAATAAVAAASNNNNNNSNITTTTSNNNNNVNNSTNSGEVTQCIENIEGPRMLVLLPNGERKLVRFPISQQNVHFNQLWQQVRFSLGSQITIVTNEQLGEKNNAGQLLIKSVAIENQEPKILHDSFNASSVITSTTSDQDPNTMTASAAITTQQQKPRCVTPRLVTSSPGNNLIRSRTHCNAIRVPAPRVINHGMVAPPQHHQSQNLLPQANSISATNIQVQPLKEVTSPIQHVKEAPRFVAGQAAICPFCGISSLDFNKCIRCRRKLPPNVKSQSIFTVKKKKPEKAGIASEDGSQNSQNDSDGKGIESSPENKDKKSSPVSDKKKQKTLPKKKKITDEPAEILILSSDDEEEAQANKVEAPRDLPLLSKEPVYVKMDLTNDEIAALKKGTSLVDDLMENIQPELFTTLQCRSVRIGSFKAQPKERIFMCSKGVKMNIASLKNENITLIIPSTEILKILIHFGKQMPVLFIYATPRMGFHIRSQLGMENKTGPYYDPTSVLDETHKRITLILEKMTEENKMSLNNMFKQNKLSEELSEKEANEILIRASPHDEQGVISTKQTDTVRKIMIYPPPPEKGGIALNNQDYACLGEDQFLNDVIIDFYLKYLLLKVLSPMDRERTHVFSTFFYKRLTTKPKTIRKNDPENDPKLSPAEKRHMRVKGWTKQVNLFEKDFIIVPINEHSHWFLAIICFPGLTGPVKYSDNTPVEPEDVQPIKSPRTVQIGNTTITHIVKSERNSVSLDMDQGSDRDEAEGDQDDLHPSSDEEESEQYEEESVKNASQVEIPLLNSSNSQLPQGQGKEAKAKTVKRKIFKEPIKQPCILIFDSLAGASRVRVVATLRDYLKIEYKKKMGHDREFSRDTIKGAVPKVPQQNNFTDCGLYVLQYVESFFQDPLHDFKLPLKYLQDWFPEEAVSCKRQELAILIRSLMEEQGIKVEEMGLPNLTFASGNTAGEEQAKMEEEEDEANEDEEEIEKSTAEIPEFENEEEDMDLCDDEEEEQEEEEEDEEDEEEDEIFEELDLNELQKSGMHLSNPSNSESEAECCQTTPTKICLPLYDGNVEERFSSDENCSISGVEKKFSESCETIGDIQKYGSAGRKGRWKKLEEIQMGEQRKNVPLTEFQDFESQISCTTIEKNRENIVYDSDVVMSEIEEEESRMKGERKMINQSFEKKGVGYHEKIGKEKKALDVTNIINKLVSVKGITVCRMDDGAGVKQLENKRVKVNCDTKSNENSENSESDAMKTNSPSIKRSFEALKSVRIQKKAERAVCVSKRQRIDET